MGRLTLNVLLSFAQFEREVTGERIRDKIAASKRKGLWMGGFVPLGYEASGRTLVINQSEAETIRTIYRLYLKLRSVDALAVELDRLGLRTKLRAGQGPRMLGGKAFSRGHLYRILSNPLYVGEIAHKSERHKGQHERIIDEPTWDAAQAMLKGNCHQRRIRTNARDPSLLAGLLLDANGHPFTSTHAVKDGKRYRYYVAMATEQATASRLPAMEVETALVEALQRFLSDQHQLIATLGLDQATPDQLLQVFGAADVLSDQLGQSTAKTRETTLSLVRQVAVSDQELRIKLRSEALGAEASPDPDDHRNDPILTVPVGFTRRRGETRIVIQGRGGDPNPTTDPALLKAIARGHAWFAEIATGQAMSSTEIAGRERVTERYVSCLMRLAFLAPEVVEACLAGRQAVGLSAKRLTLDVDLPLLWTEQALKLTS